MTAAGDKLGAAQVRKKSAALGREYRAFCETTGLTPRPERTRSMTGPTVVKAGSGLAKQGGYGILKSRENQGILITEEAIRRVPQVIPSGWSSDRAALLQEAHKDLLRFVKDKPVGTEAGAIYTLDMQLKKRWVGEIAKQEVSAKRCQIPHILMHNHPGGGVFSYTDLTSFLMRENTIGLTVVGNTGSVYILQKSADYDGFRFWKALDDISQQIESTIKSGNVSEYVDIIEKLLREAKQYGIEFIRG